MKERNAEQNNVEEKAVKERNAEQNNVEEKRKETTQHITSQCTARKEMLKKANI